MEKPLDKNAGVRADKWLWVARFYKTRSLATMAINGGKVHLNGIRVKPAHKLTVGDEITISKGLYTFVITVAGLSLRRGSAGVAHTLYSESEESQQQRQQLREEQRLLGKTAVRHEGRPDKRARRQIHRFKTRQAD